MRGHRLQRRDLVARALWRGAWVIVGRGWHGRRLALAAAAATDLLAELVFYEPLQVAHGRLMWYEGLAHDGAGAALPMRAAQVSPAC